MACLLTGSQKKGGSIDTKQVYPLRIQKGTASPTKLPRPLSELAPTEQRRNSPSFTQSTKNTQKMALNGDSSPFQSSPFNASEGNSSPRLFWQGRDPATPKRFNSENNGVFVGRETSPSPTRRSSIERLQRASRVKNSNMFAREQKQEYDPTAFPVIERPLAKQLQGNSYGGSGLEGLRSAERQRPFGLQRNDSITGSPLYSPTKTPLKSGGTGFRSPSKDQISPTKSSLAAGRFNGKSSFDSENGQFSEDNSGDERSLPPGRALHRHAKSVTFDAAPPQVNEYEMTTPDLSSIGTGSRENSYDSGEDEDEDSYIIHGDSMEQDDSFDASLEDTDKTPVVGPDDWRHASPDAPRNGRMSGQFEDPFEGPEGSPMPEARPTSSGRQAATRNDSLNSNGDHRPLPPLPGMSHHVRNGSASSIGLSAAAERATQRNLPSPPAASPVSKSDIQGMSGGKLTLEERLQLMMIQDEDKPKTVAEQQRERRMRRAGAGPGARERQQSHTPEREQSITIHEDEDTLDDLPDLGTYQLPPRISRESIMRKVNGQETFSRDSDYNFSSPMPSSSPERPPALDPDTPIPSTEDASVVENDDSVVIKPEPEEDEIDVYSIPDMYQRNESRVDDYDNAHLNPPEEDAGSDYSDPTPINPELQSSGSSGEDDLPTPQPEISIPQDPLQSERKDSIPEFKGFMDNHDFGLSLNSYMTPSPPPPPPKDVPLARAPSVTEAQQYLQRSETPEERHMPTSKPEYDGTGWGSDEDDELDSGTPDSVIRHPLAREPSPPHDSPSIPERVATIKSSGSKLKTRPSATPSDLVAMREMRRQVSGEKPNIPPIPDRHRNRPSLSLDRELGEEEKENAVERYPSFKKKSLTLDIGSDLGLSLDQDFDRVIEAQKVAFNPSSHSAFAVSENDNGQASDPRAKIRYNYYANLSPRKQRGYLMRQNTKLIVASSDDKGDGTRSAGNSPVKQDRPQSWTVEPWNGQMRKASNRSNPRKKPAPGVVPPMPGHDSNVTECGIIAEEHATTGPVVEQTGERGRLFVKVIGVKDLDLPLPKSKSPDARYLMMLTILDEQTWFSLTLDNGVHCVTTAWLELGRNAPIGQEFELVVPNELEFQLTLNAKLVKPAPKRVIESPTKGHKAQKSSTFSRVFASPKKRKEIEMRHKEEEERLAEQRRKEQAKIHNVQPTGWDLISPLAAEDGSFGRSYVCLKDHESKCYGRPYVVDVAAFNEWATEEATYSSSVKGKRGATVVQRRAPYKVGKLELQLLFVPKPKGATDDDIPKSMNSCIREMKEAEQALARNWEGHLSQQGGDCPYWRRRYFKLVGTKLTAYHESTRQPRATINLANASKLIDDRSALTQKETSGKGGKRRRSGFAEEEEGYMFVEEGFRIRFNNGEVIDFYADTAADKDGWMKVLEACVGKEGEAGRSKWCDLVLKREDSTRRKSEVGHGTTRGGRHHQRTKSHGV
ncbi:Bud site selection protein BUD4 [Lachnellula arida]|uniref:Bud site selection protein BUD4 n=1 Tax=Lachnellula arida TaxID=1316785 RepID=A0A8T9BC64_9HELO|nr:Bud site selection protein BUD4 [Lachnellula arida]